MSANTSPIFVLTPQAPQVRISTANTNRDGTGTLGSIVTAGANGSFYPRFRIQPEVAIPSGDVVRIYRQKGGSGNNELMAEIPIPILNPGTSGAGTPPFPTLPSFVWPDPNTPGQQNVGGISMGASDVYKASTDQGKTYSVSAEEGGDY